MLSHIFQNSILPRCHEGKRYLQKSSLKFILELMHEEKSNQSKKAIWLKRFGIAGFLFFLIKGLLWLIVPLLIAYLAW